MSLLPFPTCPTCDQKIDLSYLYSKCSQDRNGIFKDRPVGITCPHCHAKLRVRQFWEIFVRTLMCAIVVIGFLPLLIWTKTRTEDANNAVSLLFFVVAFLVVGMGSKYRRFTQLVNVKMDELPTVRFPLETKTEELSHAESEEQRAEQESYDWAMKNSFSDVDKSSSWRCSKCKEENPASFEVCWNCQHEHAKQS